jgi:hypothetical protein
MKNTILILVTGLILASFVAIADNADGMQSGNAIGQDNANLIATGISSKISAGQYLGENGEGFEISNMGDKTQLRINNFMAETDLNITSETDENGTTLKVKLSNGKGAEIKVMPNTASETALTRLRLKVCNETNNCTIVLKETGTGNQTRLTYEMTAQQSAKVLGLFKTKMSVEAQIDAETGEVIQSKRPWWSFLAVQSQ